MTTRHRKYIVLSIAAAALLRAGVPPAPARQEGGKAPGRLRGTITGPAADEFSEEVMLGRRLERYEMHGSGTHSPVRPYGLPEKAVVYIESVPGEPQFDPSSRHARLDQTGMSFRPLVLPVLTGTIVDFPNNDDLFHNVFSYSLPKEFDLGRYPKGRMKSVTFDKAGIVKVYCDIHSYMFATILVLENPYFAVPDRAGKFEIPAVPPGTYTVVFWYGRGVAEKRTVTVDPGSSTEVDFAYTR